MKLQMLKRSPWMFIITTVTIIGFAFLLGSNFTGKIEIPTYSNVSVQKTEALMNLLQESESFEYVLVNQQEAEEKVVENKSELAVELNENGGKIIISAEGRNGSLVHYEVLESYQKYIRNEAVRSSVSTNSNSDNKDVEKTLQNLDEYSPFHLKAIGYQSEDTFVYDSQLQNIFGFSLFFVVFTIAFNVVTILKEKKDGVWNRILLSPIRKWELYLGNLLYSFIIGYIQVVAVFSVFHFGIGIDFYGAFGKTLIILIPFVFAIVALALLVASLVKDLAQFNVVMPLITVSMAMLGGAYWPLEVVSSEIILKLANISPIKFAMEALNGATIYGYEWNALLFPLGMLMVVGLVMLVIGVFVIDRK